MAELYGDDTRSNTNYSLKQTSYGRNQSDINFQNHNGSGSGLNSSNIDDGSSSQIDKTQLQPIQINKTLALLNLFTVRTGDFLNGFAKSVQNKLYDMDKQLHELQTTVEIYQSKFDSLPQELFTEVSTGQFAPVTTAPQAIASEPNYQNFPLSNEQKDQQQFQDTASNMLQNQEEYTPPEQQQQEPKEMTDKQLFLQELEEDPDRKEKWNRIAKLYKLRIPFVQVQHRISTQNQDYNNLKYLIDIRKDDQFNFKQL